MGIPLKNPPVYFTLAQVQFNPILKLPDFLPAIQEGFRKIGFPDYTMQKMFVLNLAVQNGLQVPAMPGLVDRFVFRNVERTKSFLLDPDKLIFQSTDYGRFEAFSGHLLQGLELLNQILHLDFTERVGLRYLDRVAPVGDDQLSQYLVQEVLGVSGRLGGKPLRSFSEAFNEFGDIKLLSRVIIQEGRLAFPPDLASNNMVVAKRFQEYTGPHAILDNDGFVEGRETYSAAALQKHLNAIHDVLKAAFNKTATSHAFAIWEK
jgi:uncharacterized protein (TIGR04255 family)